MTTSNDQPMNESESADREVEDTLSTLTENSSTGKTPPDDDEVKKASKRGRKRLYEDETPEERRLRINDYMCVRKGAFRTLKRKHQEETRALNAKIDELTATRVPAEEHEQVKSQLKKLRLVMASQFEQINSLNRRVVALMEDHMNAYEEPPVAFADR